MYWLSYERDNATPRDLDTWNELTATERMEINLIRRHKNWLHNPVAGWSGAAMQPP